MAVVEAETDCIWCGKRALLEVSTELGERIKAWQKGRKENPSRTPFIQDALPELSPAQREVLISGTHDECFDKMFPPEDEG